MCLYFILNYNILYNKLNQIYRKNKIKAERKKEKQAKSEDQIAEEPAHQLPTDARPEGATPEAEQNAQVGEIAARPNQVVVRNGHCLEFETRIWIFIFCCRI